MRDKDSCADSREYAKAAVPHSTWEIQSPFSQDNQLIILSIQVRSFFCSYIPELIKFYTNELCQIVSQSIGIELYPTSLDLPTSCAIITYNKKNDGINWHYDHNYYNGRFFTVLIPITPEKTCTKFQILDKNNKIISFELNKKSICFEGNYVFHRASKLCKNENRTILSCQFVTQNSMSLLNRLKIKFKDFAFTGSLLKV